MTTPISAGWYLTLKRAHDHLSELEQAIVGWFNGDHHTVTVEPSPKGPTYRRYFVEAEPVPLDPFSTIVSDVLQNARSGLDQLAYALNASGSAASGLHKDFAESSEFPIFGDEDSKGKPGSGATLFHRAAHKYRAMDKGAITVIEGLQPYQRGNNFRSDPLWLLHDLVRIAKHRLIHSVAYTFGGANMVDPGQMRQAMILPCLIEVNTQGRPVEGKTQFLELALQSIYYGQEVKVDFEPALGVAFASGLASGQQVDIVLGRILNHINTSVVTPLEPFLP